MSEQYDLRTVGHQFTDHDFATAFEVTLTKAREILADFVRAGVLVPVPETIYFTLRTNDTTQETGIAHQ